MKRSGKIGVVAAAVAVTASVLFGSGAGNAADRAFPDSVDTSKRYLFYMHGNIVEKIGPHKQYQYYQILDRLERGGVVVVGEARGETRMSDYAATVADQVRRLVAAGVPPGNITVAGHSKGGLMSLMVASMIGEPEVRYGALAACGLPGDKFFKPYRMFIDGMAATMKGVFLVMWEESDTDAGACDDAMAVAGAAFRNTVLTVGEGHQLFYRPAESWITPLLDFANGT